MKIEIKTLRKRVSTFLLAGFMLCLAVTVGSCEDDEVQEEECCIEGANDCLSTFFSCDIEDLCYDNKSDCIRESECCN